MSSVLFPSCSQFSSLSDDDRHEAWVAAIVNAFYEKACRIAQSRINPK